MRPDVRSFFSFFVARVQENKNSLVPDNGSEFNMDLNTNRYLNTNYMDLNTNRGRVTESVFDETVNNM